MIFETYKDTAGKHRFRLKAANGEIVATGEDYENRSDMIDTINAIKRGAPHAKIQDLDKVED